MEIRIASWNMAYWSHKKTNGEAWNYFLNDLDVDIFLFQEAKPPENVIKETNFIWHEIGETRPWGSGIYSSKYKLSEELISTRFKGSCVIANTECSEKKFTFISLCGLLEKIGNGPSYSIPNLHRILSDLTGIFNGHINGKRNIVLGGDLNASIQFDQQFGGEAHRIFFDRLKDFKLISCFEPFFTDFIQTYRHSKSKIKWQNDYFFISESLSKKLLCCEVIDNDKVRRYSDHNPVVITLDL